MPRPPKTQPAIDTADAGINQESVSGAMVAMRDQAQEDFIELLDLAGGVQAYQAMQLVKSFASAAQVQLFKRIRESKQIKHLPIRTPEGGVKTFDSIRDACPELFGRTYQSMLDAEERYDLLGNEAYEAASRLRLNSSALRAARALPPEKLEIVRLAIGTGSSKADVLSVIEDLAEKVQATEAQVTELQAEKEASDHLVEAKNKTIDKLQRQLKQIEKLPPDAAEALVLKEAADIQSETPGMVRGHLRQALIALQNLPEDQTLFMAGMVGQVMSDLVALRDEFSLPEVGGKPEWEKWAEKNGASTAGKAN